MATDKDSFAGACGVPPQAMAGPRKSDKGWRRRSCPPSPWSPPILARRHSCSSP